MARGAMVRYLAENKIEDIKDITSFNELDYVFDASQSTEKLYIFQKKAIVMIAFLIIRQPFAFVPYMLYMPYHLYSR